MRALGNQFVVICLLLCASVAFAQGRGGRGGGGGGFGGGFGGRGGQPSTPEERSARLDEMLKSLDTNGDGMLDENELSAGPGRFIVQRVFVQMGIQPTYPIAISTIKDAMEKAYQNMGQGGPQGGRGNYGQGGRGGRGQRTPRNGQPGDDFGRARGGAPSPSGPTTLGFGAPNDPAKPVAQAASASPADVDQKARSLAELLVRKFDKNSDSRLDKDEWPSPSKWGTFADANRAGATSIGVTEIAAYLAGAFRSGKLSSLDSPDATTTVATSDPSKPARPKSGRFLTAKERLPAGLPDWFLKLADEDGQVPMADFAEVWTPEEAARFAQYDLNHDGVITAAECLKAEKQQRAGAR